MNIPKIKQTLKDHAGEIVLVGIGSAAILATAILAYKQQEAEAKFAAELNAFVIDRNKHGQTVAQLIDGSYIAYTPA